MILKYFYFLDLFRRPIYVLFNTQDKVASRLGLVCSLLIYTLIIYDFTKNDIFYKESPKIMDQPLTDAYRRNIEYSNRVFTVSVVDDNSLPYVDPSIFVIKAKNVLMISNSAGGFDQIDVQYYDMHLCNEQDFLQDPSVFLNLGLNNSFCLDNNSFEMFGYWDEPTVKYFSFELSLCDNNTSPVICKPSSVINSFFTMKYFNLVYSDLRVDAQNYQTPLLTKYRNDFQLIDTQLNKMMSIFIKAVNLYTDDGLLYSNQNYQSGLAYDSSFTDFSMLRTRSITTDIRFVCDFYSAKESNKITRTYQKFTEVFASIGGLLSFLMIVGFLLTYFEKKYYLTKKIMNSLYSFQQEHKDDGTKNLFQGSQIIELKRAPTQQSPEKEGIMSMDDIGGKDTGGSMQKISGIDQVLEPKEEKDEKSEKPISQLDFSLKPKYGDLSESGKTELKSQKGAGGGNNPKLKDKTSKINQFRKFQNGKSKISINFLEYIHTKIMNICSCCTKSFKQRLYIKAEEIYENEMDITYILKKIQEIEKLKLVLLNPKQLSLFNLLAKPMIYVDKDKNKGLGGGYTISELISSTLHERSLKMAIEYYESQQKYGNESDVDRRLFNLVDENVNEFKTHFQDNNS